MQSALIRQARTPDGIELTENLQMKINTAKSISDLLAELDDSQCLNWLDTRLLEVLAYSSKSPSAMELIEAYRNLLLSKKLQDVLPKQLKHLKAKTDYVTAVKTKTKMDPDKTTIRDFINYQWTIEDVVLDLGRRILNVDHVNKGCLEINYLIPVYYSFIAYKMALINRDKFYAADIMHIEIGKHPLIYDPWLCDIEKYPLKQVFPAKLEGELSCYYV